MGARGTGTVDGPAADAGPTGTWRAVLGDAYLQGAQRLRWDARRLAAERQRRLRELLAWAATRSSFWAERLGRLDVSTFTEADLRRLPVLTKPEMMAEFDRLVTVPELTMDRVLAHLGSVGTEPYLDGTFRVVSTSGTEGARSFVVYRRDEWATLVTMATRWRGRMGDRLGATLASLYTQNPLHVSGALHAATDFGADDEGWVHLAPTAPLADLVDRLNALRPSLLQGYPSVVAALAGQAADGRLRIAPEWISTCGEQLTEETRAAARAQWSVEIADVYGCSEGLYAFPCAGQRRMHVPDDLVVIEPVDAEGNAVGYGQRADRILLTNLYNRTQPLIRYEITDAMTFFDDPCPCGCAHRRIGDLEGRTSGFRYPGGAIVPGVGFVDVLHHDAAVTDLHVVQTARGARVALTTRGPCDTARLQRQLVAMLERCGVEQPIVEVEVVGSLERLWSGKSQQFVPLQGMGRVEPSDR